MTSNSQVQLPDPTNHALLQEYGGESHLACFGSWNSRSALPQLIHLVHPYQQMKVVDHVLSSPFGPLQVTRTSLSARDCEILR